MKVWQSSLTGAPMVLNLPALHGNGQDGYEKVVKYHPDIVMTDIKMPVMDGLGLIRELKEEFPDIQVIVLSGYGRI